MTLPLFVTRKTKVAAGIVMFGLSWLMYHMTNHHPIFEATLLPLTALDQAIPFLPWTVVIYVSEYVFFPVIFLTCRNMDNLNKYIYSFFALQTFSCLIFFFWPTTFPRDLFPVPADTHNFIRNVWFYLRQTDSPLNCFPSLHVSSVFLSVFIFRDEQKEKFPFFFVWGLLIAFSTLPTKQHYIVDVVAGGCLAVFSYYLFHRVIQYRRVELSPSKMIVKLFK